MSRKKHSAKSLSHPRQRNGLCQGDAFRKPRGSTVLDNRQHGQNVPMDRAFLVRTLPRTKKTGGRWLGISFVLSSLYLPMGFAWLMIGVSVFWAQQALQAAGKGPEASFEETEVNLPLHLWFRPVSHLFQYENKGDSPLEIEVQKTSCGCLSSLLSSVTLEQGATGEVEVGYKPTGGRKRLGKQSFTATLGTNDPERPSIDLTLKVELVEPVEVQPKVVAFGDVSRGGPHKVHLEILCLGEKSNPRILSVTSSSPAFVVHWASSEKESPPLPIEGKASGQLAVSTDPLPDSTYETSAVSVDPRTKTSLEVEATAPVSEGPIREYLFVRTDSKVVPQVEIPVLAAVGVQHDRPSVVCDPAKVLFGIVKTNEEVERVCRIEIASPLSPVSLRVECADPRVSAVFEEGEKGKGGSLRVRFSACERTGRVKTSIEIFNDANVKILDIPVYGVVAEPSK